MGEFEVRRSYYILVIESRGRLDTDTQRRQCEEEAEMRAMQPQAKEPWKLEVARNRFFLRASGRQAATPTP